MRQTTKELIDQLRIQTFTKEVVQLKMTK